MKNECRYFFELNSVCFNRFDGFDLFKQKGYYKEVKKQKVLLKSITSLSIERTFVTNPSNVKEHEEMRNLVTGQSEDYAIFVGLWLH